MSDLNSPRPDGAHRADTAADTAADTDDPQVAALQADIERTREQLADTVDQLQAKLDVRARASAGAHDLAERTKAKVVDADGHPRPAAMGAGGAVIAGLAAVALVALWRRRQRQRPAWKKGWR